MEAKEKPVAVLGAGSWGTAIAISLTRGGKPAILWGRDGEQIAKLETERCNNRYLPGIPLPEALTLSSDLQHTITGAGDIIVVVPSHAFRAMLKSVAPFLHPEQRIAWATKGFESGTGKLLHEVVQDIFGGKKPIAVISGPTFAKEVANGLPTAVTVASNDHSFAEYLANRLHTATFRVYTSEDIVGVEVGGAVKNVLAIAAGIADGLSFGANARTALITRGLAEIMRLGDALGGHRETFMGLAGLGDLVLTCTDNQSRNRRLGLGLGKGESLEDVLAAIDQVVEGVQTAREVNELAVSLGVDMPISHEVYRILYEGERPREAVHALLSREQKPESI
ncbi:MAG: NAD(P)H-dependent glycerol-3-phosphate dehydrogenase [Gammaproteobacteria bacterium]|nr:NAD(P)H-dependent glycerol-3-phosphate dehydrogenase [Gammaproteobacteria bacterium]